MRFARVVLSFLSTLVFVALPPRPGMAADGAIAVESTSSWMTPARPEVHLLLRNRTAQPIEFSLRLGRGSAGESVHCAADLREVDPNFVERFDRLAAISRMMTSGVIPPNGWVHRSYPVGASGGVPPCQVPYVVGSDHPSEIVTGTIEVPRAAEAWEGVDVGKESLTWESMVEEDQRYGERVITRLLVQNRDKLPILVSASERALSCKEGADARWALQDSVIQGENIGPALIGVGGWIVLVDAIELANRDDAAKCEAVIQLSAFTKSGTKPVATAKFSLAPSGRFSVPFVRKQ